MDHGKGSTVDRSERGGERKAGEVEGTQREGRGNKEGKEGRVGRKERKKGLRDSGKEGDRKKKGREGRRVQNNSGRSRKRQGEGGHVGAKIATRVQQSKAKAQESLKYWSTTEQWPRGYRAERGLGRTQHVPAGRLPAPPLRVFGSCGAAWAAGPSCAPGSARHSTASSQLRSSSGSGLRYP